MKHINLLEVKRVLPCMLGIALFASVAMTSCDDKDYGNPMEETRLVSGITLNVEQQLPLAIGTDSLISYSITPENPTDRALLWVSSNEQVATVTSTGLIQAKGLGEATITVTPAIGFGATSTVKVQVITEVTKATSLAFQDMTPSIFMGEKLTMTPNFTPANCTYKSLRWSSDNESIATVSSVGVVTAIAPGTVHITATTLDKSEVKATATMTVKELIPVENIEIIPLDDDMGLGEVIKLQYDLMPQDATVANIEWSTSNKDVITVEDGIVTAVGVGSAIITAKAPQTGNTSSITITVPAGLIREDFDGTTAKWNVVTSGASQAITEGKLVVTMAAQNAEKWRGDLALAVANKTAKAIVHAGQYPYLAIKYTKPTSGNITLDTALGKYKNSQNNSEKLIAPDGVEVHYYDLTQNFGASSKLSLEEPTELATFQFKIADVPSTLSRTYEVYWVRTFKTLDELKAFVNK